MYGIERESELANIARTYEPEFPYGGVECNTHLLTNPSCMGCKHEYICKYFVLGMISFIRLMEKAGKQ